ncbi:MAG: DNA translocase FtsK 4TM domain-containing protein [Patescibacteria group bacterium]|nr:DNA translocase FtsK [Patescibacteria group bacterium]MDE1945819.1 DNA translocase FtsK 4TM domain-containing protein [Patescibacteria group bacterium]
MAKQKEKTRKNDAKESSWSRVKGETKQAIIAIAFLVLFVIFLLAAFGKAGMVGNQLYTYLSELLGIGYYLIPLFFLMLSISFFRAEEKEFNRIKVAGGLLFFVSGLGLIDLVSRTYFTASGGWLGHIISTPLLNLFSFAASAVILIALIIIACLVLFETRLTVESIMFWKKWQKKEEPEDEEKDVPIVMPEEKPLPVGKPVKEPEEKPEKKSKGIFAKKDDEELKVADRVIRNSSYAPPPISLLEDDKGRVVSGDVKANANIIKRTLANFGIDVEMDEVSIGPSVTRYALKPAEGVKISRILGLQNDLSLALAAHPLRIEAPIPGKSLVGIEIPNSVKSTVGLASLVSADEFQKSDKPLLITLGRGISGKSHYANLAKMPHVLVAGATGSGKSVTIHAIITSLLYRNSPEQLRFIMIDPKRVELTLYNKIPHLLTPVITDAKKTILALKWATKEMDRRYDVLESHAVKDIDSYHKNVLAPALKKAEEAKKGGKGKEPADLPEAMPFIVLVIDELADIMMAYPRELEAGIVRLAQMSRAVGIHLILSTQRPSVNVITGIIKANIPTRIALQVVSQIDSRTILDTTGAEKLLGAGDMLYLGGESAKPVRIQSAYVSEKEVKDVAKYLANAYKEELIGGEIDLGGDTGGGEGGESFGGEIDGDDDELYMQAKDEVMKAGKASTSYLQRKLRIGYARAARLIDLLEQKGVIGPGDGAKPREVIGGESTPKTDAEKEAENLHEDGDYL